VAVFVSFVLNWLIVKPKLLHTISQNPTTFVILTFAGIGSICFFYFTAKRWPHFAVGLAVQSVGLILIIVSAIVRFVFNLHDVWINRALGLGKALIFLACLIFIWQAKKKSKAEKSVRFKK
jgi:hypothetical protein